MEPAGAAAPDAMEAVKQGGACVGCRSDTHVVIAALKRSNNELSSYQPKVFKIDEHLGIGVSGLTADGRVLCRFMRAECINHRFVYDTPLAVGRLCATVADRSQANTQRSWKRPYGVGLLVAGADATGPHLYQTCPSGNYYEYKAMAVGARSQASRTYLEKTFTQFPQASLDDLVRHGLRALREAVSDGELSAKAVSLAFVGTNQAWTLLTDDECAARIATLDPAEPAEAEAAAEPAAEAAAGGEAAAAAPGAEAGAADAAAPMVVE